MKSWFALSRGALWLIVVNGVFSISVGLSNTFVNVYLWKVDRSYGMIGWYNFLIYTTIPIAFIASGALAKRLHAIWTLRIGIALHAVFYGIALVGGTAVARWPWLLGMIMGLAGGFYWFSFNTQSFVTTKHGDRDRFYGYNGVVGAVSGMIAPPIAGILIAKEDLLGGLTGYHIIFGLSLGLFLLAVVLSFQLHAEIDHGRLHPIEAIRALSNPRWRMVLIGCFLYGPREGVFMFLIGLLLYIATGSEARLGEFVLLQSGLSFAAFYLVGKLVKPHNRLWMMGVGAVGMWLVASLFLFPISTRLIVWYGGLIAIVLPIFLIPLQGFIFDSIGALTPTGFHAEHVIAREVFENAGRVAGIGVFIGLWALGIQSRGISWFAFGLGTFQLLTWASIAYGIHAERSSGRPYDTYAERNNVASGEDRPLVGKRGKRRANV